MSRLRSSIAPLVEPPISLQRKIRGGTCRCLYLVTYRGRMRKPESVVVPRKQFCAEFDQAKKNHNLSPSAPARANVLAHRRHYRQSVATARPLRPVLASASALYVQGAEREKRQRLLALVLKQYSYAQASTPHKRSCPLPRQIMSGREDAMESYLEPTRGNEVSP